MKVISTASSLKKKEIKKLEIVIELGAKFFLKITKHNTNKETTKVKDI